MGRTLRTSLAVAVAGLVAAAVAAGPATPAAAADTGSLGGHLRTSAGTPGPVVGVSLHDTSGNQQAWTATDTTGAYSFTGVAPGTYKVAFHYDHSLTIWAHGRSEWEADTFEVVAGATTTVDEVAPDFGALTITVTDSVTGAPIEGANLYYQGGPMQFYSGLTDASGRVTVANLLPGTYDVGVGGPTGYLNGGVTGLVVTANATATAGATLQRSVNIHVTIVDRQTGQPVTACLSYLIRGRGNTPTAYPNCTDTTGLIRLDGFPSDSYGFLVVPVDGVHGAQFVGREGPTGDQSQIRWFRPAAGTTQQVTVRVDKAGTISGIVRDRATSAPVEGICPLPFPSGGSYDDGLQYGLSISCSGADGRYEMRNLGPYYWKVQFPDFSGAYAWQWSGNAANRAAATPVRVRAGRTTTANTALRPAGLVTGTVTRTDGGPVQWTYVSATDAVTGDAAAPGRSPNTAGVYTLRGFNDGRVRISVSYSGDDSVPYPSLVTVRAGTTVSGIDVTVP